MINVPRVAAAFVLLVVADGSFAQIAQPERPLPRVHEFGHVYTTHGPNRCRFEILREEAYGNPVRAQVTIEALVLGVPTEASLRQLLVELYEVVYGWSGFRYFDHPTHILMHVFTSTAHWDGFDWIAMLANLPGDDKPRITVQEKHVEALGARPRRRFGLNEATRRLIYMNIWRVESRARCEAELTYPVTGDYSEQQIRKQVDLQSKLSGKYKERLSKRYGITREEVGDIGSEGLTKGWPTPIFKPCDT